MIDPVGKSYWRLELRQRDRAPPRQTTSMVAEWLIDQYDYRLEQLRNEKRASPAKTARGELAAQFKMTDEQIRAIIRRGRGR
jgi:hypothetical protein